MEERGLGSQLSSVSSARCDPRSLAAQRCTHHPKKALRNDCHAFKLKKLPSKQLVLLSDFDNPNQNQKNGTWPMKLTSTIGNSRIPNIFLSAQLTSRQKFTVLLVVWAQFVLPKNGAPVLHPRKLTKTWVCLFVMVGKKPPNF